MVIQIQRISAQSIVRSAVRCAEPLCHATATWSLIDLGMANADRANGAQRPCCVKHIPSAYLNLRGAHIIAQSVVTQARGTARTCETATGIDRRPRRKRRTIASLGDRKRRVG